MKKISVTNHPGFTLLETIIYVGLFGVIFTGLFVSIYPLLTGAERLTNKITTEGEIAFILAKIEYILSNTITDENGEVTMPLPDNTSDQLVLSYAGEEIYRLALADSGDFCAIPLVCQMITIAQDGGEPLPLNNQRIVVENLVIKHHAPTEQNPRHLSFSFTVNGQTIGPVQYYLYF